MKQILAIFVGTDVLVNKLKAGHQCTPQWHHCTPQGKSQIKVVDESLETTE
jgi:hypothetical protein